MLVFNVQVSEVAAVPDCLPGRLRGAPPGRAAEYLVCFLKPLVVLGVASVLLVIQPDFGATVVLVTAAAGMIFLSGVWLTRFAPLIAILAVLGTVLVVTQPYRLKRVVSYLDPGRTSLILAISSPSH